MKMQQTEVARTEITRWHQTTPILTKSLVCHIYINPVSKSISFSLIRGSIGAQNGLSS